MAPCTNSAEPRELAKLDAAFEDAWKQLVILRRVDSENPAMEREKLSAIVMALWQADHGNDLSTTAVMRMLSEKH